MIAKNVEFLGSPSLRVNGLDVEPAARAVREYGMMCRTYSVDGGDNHSRLSLPELLRLASEADAQIYSMSVERPVRTLAEASENSVGEVLLQSLAERRSCGWHFHVRTEMDVAHAMATFGELPRNEYVIGYKPPDATLPGK